MFAWYDFWVGLFYDRKSRVLYIFPIPMLGIKIEMRSDRNDNNNGVNG